MEGVWVYYLKSLTKVELLLQVELYSCFRPGDLVRAEVISLGDSRSYYLSTAKNDLGVVYAKSLSGERHAIAQSIKRCNSDKLRCFSSLRTGYDIRCCAGVPMIPLSWQEMQCPETKVVEKRKVAKVN